MLLLILIIVGAIIFAILYIKNNDILKPKEVRPSINVTKNETTAEVIKEEKKEETKIVKNTANKSFSVLNSDDQNLSELQKTIIDYFDMKI